MKTRQSAPYNTGVTKPDDLLAYLFDGKRHLLTPSLRQWMEASPRFTAFVDTYRDKIRKKIRIARQPESALDLRSELEVARCLLLDRRLEVAYEPYASEKRRGPDFAVAYRVNVVFNIEVARIREQESSSAAGHSGVLRRKEERILRIVLDKLGQMQPGMPNLLVIRGEDELAAPADLGRLMQDIKTRAELKDPAFYAGSRKYTGPADFYKDFNHLSGILLTSGVAQAWMNKQARPGIEEKTLRLVGSLLSSTGPLAGL